MKRFITLTICLILSSPAFAITVYFVEDSYNDEIFIINGEKFEAQTYCFNINEGDSVVFLEGSPLGPCTTAVIKDLDTGSLCKLWCE